MEKKWVVYLLECCDGSYYTGVTNDLGKRVRVHKSGKGSKYVRTRGFGCIVATKDCLDRSGACKCEYHIKKLNKNEKLDWFRKG